MEPLSDERTEERRVAFPKERARELKQWVRWLSEMVPHLKPYNSTPPEVPVLSMWAPNEFQGRAYRFCELMRSWAMEELDETARVEVRKCIAEKKAGPRHKADMIQQKVREFKTHQCVKPWSSYQRVEVRNGFIDGAYSDDEEPNDVARRVVSLNGSMKFNCGAKSSGRSVSRSRSRSRDVLRTKSSFDRENELASSVRALRVNSVTD